MSLTLLVNGLITGPVGAQNNRAFYRDKFIFKNLRKAEKLLAKDKTDQALTILGQLKKYDPNRYSSSVHGNAAVAFYKKKNYQMAVSQGMKALKYDASRSWVMWYIAKADLKLGQFNHAKKWFDQYVKSSKSSKEAKRRSEEAANAMASHFIEVSKTAEDNKNFAQARDLLKQARQANAKHYNEWIESHIAFLYLKEASHYLSIGKRVDAKLILEEAKTLPPGDRTASIHRKLAYVFSRLGNNKGAIQEATIAHQMDPKDTYTMRYLAGAYSRIGDYDKAINWYQMYADKTKDKEDKQYALDEIRDLNDDREKAALHSATSPDYIDELKTVRIWKQDAMPLKVFIPIGTGVKGYRDNFPQLVLESLQAWRKASGNKISFQLLPKPINADISIEWTAQPITKVEKGRLRDDKAGIARVSIRRDGTSKYPYITNSRVQLRTVDTYKQNPLSDDEMKSVALHEIGHSLGLVGHSRNARDIMYYSEVSVIPALTKRDKASIKRLYQDYPPVSSSTDQLRTE